MRRIEQVPVIRHKGNGQPKIDGMYWTRASSLAKTLDSGQGLILWKAKMTARGVAISPDLVSRAVTMGADDPDWYDLVERACDRAGANQGRDDGTSIHAAAEMLELGENVSGLPHDLRRDAEAYLAALKAEGVASLAAEVFVANEAVQAAGSFDRLIAPRGDLDAAVILDIKTTNNKRRGALDAVAYATKYQQQAWAMQTAIYANGQPYDGDKGWMAWGDLGLPEPGKTVGVIAVVPRGSGTCRLVTVDLEAGWRAVQLATEVLASRRAGYVVPANDKEATA